MVENGMRLIDANALKQMFDEREADDVEMYGGVHIIECFPADDAREIVDQMPTVDAVEVVRCKDCKWYQIRAWEEGKPEYDCRKTHALLDVEPDDFCSYGERRDAK